MISTSFAVTIFPDPLIALLNLKQTTLSSNQFKLLLQITTATKQTIAKAWKSPTLVLTETKHRINQAIIHTKIEAITQDKISKFKKIWLPWMTHCLLISMNPCCCLGKFFLHFHFFHAYYIIEVTHCPGDPFSSISFLFFSFATPSLLYHSFTFFLYLFYLFIRFK